VVDDRPMTHWRVEPGGVISGQLPIPGDKSISHRAVVLGALAEGVTTVKGLLESEDVLATITAFRQMGVSIEGPEAGSLTIHGVGLHGLTPPETALDMGNSGTAMRLLAGVLCGQNFKTTLVGDASLMRRPMSRVAEPLGRMGARISTAEGGFPPVVIKPTNTLKAVDEQLAVASAQVKSAILLAGLYAEGITRVTEPAVTRNHTEKMLAGFGMEIDQRGLETELEPNGPLEPCDLVIPADISSAAFFIVGAVISPGSDLLLEGVGINPTREGVITILRQMGASISILNQRLSGGEVLADLRVRSTPLKGVKIAKELVSLAIDEFPILAIAAALADGETEISGAEELRVKESDRLSAITTGLKAIGIQVEERPDGLLITGGPIRGGRVNSFGDHRIAMAFAIAALGAENLIEIEDCANVTTSFPGFVGLAAHAGLRIREVR